MPKVITSLLALFWLMTPRMSVAQEVFGDPDFWTQLTVHHTFDKPWDVGAEFHWRMNNWVQKQQLLLRPYVGYKLNSTFHFSAGYTYVLTYPYDKYPLPKATPEQNGWEQISLQHGTERMSFTHRYRLEQRYIATLNPDSTVSFDHHQFTQRFRYRLTVGIPLAEKWKLVFFDELMVHLDRGLHLITFDRNWIHLGAQYDICPQMHIQLAYLFQYIQRTTELYERHHGIQLTANWKI